MQFNELQQEITQKAFAALIGVSAPVVTDLVQRGVIRRGQTAAEWLHAYCAHIREQAAGRAASGDLDLAKERAGLAREQKLLTEIKRRQAEKELAPVLMLTLALSQASSQIAAVLDAIPGRVRAALPDLPAEQLTMIEGEISRARNAAAEITIDLGESDDDTGDYGERDSQGDPGGRRAA